MRTGRRLFRSLVALSLVFLLVMGSATCFADAEKRDRDRGASQDRPAYREGELLIKFRDGTSIQSISAFASENGLVHEESFDFINVGLYSVKGDKSVNKAIKALEDSDGIEYVQPNYLYYPAEIPAGEYRSLWGMDAIDAPEAWNITQGSGDIVVAVIDTGVDRSHPDLKDRMWENHGETGRDSNGERKDGNKKDDDGNGYIDDAYGWNFSKADKDYPGNNSVYDDEYDDEHGTHVAGTIASSANGTGLVGVAPGVKIMPVKFIRSDGYGTTAGALNAINYAKRMGADIINASWGGPSEGGSSDTLLEEAIEASGILFVTSAGNGDEDGNGYDIDTIPVYPAAFDSNNILTVAAVDNSGKLAGFSNYGQDSVDIGAPGVGINSTVPARGEGVAAVYTTGIGDRDFGEPGEGEAFVAAFGLEHLTRQEDANDLLSRALAVVGINTGGRILLVDDDGNGKNWDDTTVYEDVYGVYDTALTVKGYTNVNVIHVPSDTSDLPDYVEMSSYDAVIWFTGETFYWDDTPLTENDQEQIIEYLKSGGKFILLGEDALDGIDGRDLLHDYLCFGTGVENYGKNQYLAGAEDTVFESVDCEIKSGPYYYRDYLNPMDDTAQAVLYYPEEPEDYYCYASGTSMAAPHVTGTAALLLSKNPELTPKQLKDAITGSGTELEIPAEKIKFPSMVNAFNALKAVAPGKPTNLQASKSGSNITLTWEGREAGDFNKYILERSIDGGAYFAIGTPGETAGKSYTDSGIDTSKTYRYRVAAVAAGEGYSKTSAYSNVVVGNTGTAVNPSPSTGKKGGGGGGGGGGGAPAAPNPSIDSKIAAALKSAKTGANIETPLVRVNGIDSVSMSAKTIEDLSKSGKSLTLTGSGADITIPASALMTEEVKKLIGDSTARLSVNVREITGEEAKKLAGNAGTGMFMVGDRIFEFTAELKASTGTINISKFVQELKISIKLSAAELKGIDGNKLGVYFYNADKKAWEYVGGVFNSQAGTMTFDTGHFSQYIVMRSEGTYTDIGKHWAKPEIELMAAKHIIEAAAGGEFGPDVNITRAEIIKMLVNVLRYDPDKNVELITPATATFKDVSTGSPYFSYVETAVKYGITKGNTGGTFGPDDTVTREQFATMMIRAMGIVTDSDSSVLPFDDKGDIPEWAEKSVIAAYERGLMTGIGGNKFGVGSTATRAQAAVTIKRVMEKSGLLLAPEKLTGKLVINDIEGQHFELETAEGIYVIIHDADNKYLEKFLSGSVGKEVEVSGYEQSGYNIYQRGKLFKAISIQLK